MHLLDPGNSAALPLSMLLIFGAARLLAEVCERCGQPGVVGEILAGVILGPSVLAWIKPGDLTGTLAGLGAMFLLFRVGLEVKSSELIGVGATAAISATLGVGVQFLVSWLVLVAWGAGRIESIFVAGALVATSVGITAHVLASKGLLQARASRVILAAAVIDDVEGLLVLAVVSSLASGKVDILQLGTTATLAVLFTVVVIKWGSRSISSIVPAAVHVAETRSNAQFTFSMILLFGLAVLAIYAGVAAIVGAFLAGLTLSEHIEHRAKDLTQGVSELLTPFFLVSIGLKVDLTAFGSGRTIALAAVLLVIAAASKVVGCGLGAIRLGKADALRVGVGMIPRGEVGMVVAQIGLTAGVIGRSVYSAIVFVTVATTIIAPPLLKLAFRGVPRVSGAEAALQDREAPHLE